MEQHETPTHPLFPSSPPGAHASLLHDAEELTGLKRAVAYEQAIQHLADMRGMAQALHAWVDGSDDVKRRIKNIADDLYEVSALLKKEKNHYDYR